MRVDTKRKHRNAGRPADKSAQGFLAWLRQRNCVFADSGECEGKTEAMHLDFAGKMDGVDPALGKGTSTKVADRYAIPGCRFHAQTQTDIGWGTFMTRMHVTREELMVAAARLWNAWPSRPKWERERAA